jgi:hypothetical protein
MDEVGVGAQPTESRRTKRPRSRLEIVLIVLMSVCLAAYVACIVVTYASGWSRASPERLGLNITMEGLSAAMFVVVAFENIRRERMFPAAILFTIAGAWLILAIAHLGQVITS